MEVPDRRLIEFKLYLAELNLDVKLHYEYMCAVAQFLVRKKNWLKDKVCKIHFKHKKIGKVFEYGDLESITIYGYGHPNTCVVVKQCLELCYEVPVDIQYLGD